MTLPGSASLLQRGPCFGLAVGAVCGSSRMAAWSRPTASLQALAVSFLLLARKLRLEDYQGIHFGRCLRAVQTLA